METGRSWQPACDITSHPNPITNVQTNMILTPMVRLICCILQFSYRMLQCPSDSLFCVCLCFIPLIFDCPCSRVFFHAGLLTLLQLCSAYDRWFKFEPGSVFLLHTSFHIHTWHTVNTVSLYLHDMAIVIRVLVVLWIISDIPGPLCSYD